MSWQLSAEVSKKQAWYRGLTKTEWLVLGAAIFGWMFDAMDQRIFIMARSAAVTSLLGAGKAANLRSDYATYVTAIFIGGWATGGVVFGLYSDKLGRVRTMLATIALYSVFTGLSAFAVNFWDFAAYRFFAGLGIGGEFAAGVALVAEVLPARSRPGALALLQVMAIVGTALGTGLSMLLVANTTYAGVAGWRWLFLAGLLPALLALILRRRLKESAAWTAAANTPHLRLGAVSELFGVPKWRRRVLVGMALGLAGQLGIWGAGTWTPELIRGALSAEHISAVGQMNPELLRADEQIVGFGLLAKDVGSCLGIAAFAWAAARYGRKPSFAVAMITGMLATVLTFGYLRSAADVWWMMPILGFCCWSVLGGYALYFPELFPTRLRASGVGVCYNAARYLTAAGILGLGNLISVFADLHYALPLRPAAITISLVYLVGLTALPWAVETRGLPLPE